MSGASNADAEQDITFRARFRLETRNPRVGDRRRTSGRAVPAELACDPVLLIAEPVALTAGR